MSAARLLFSVRSPMNSVVLRPVVRCLAPDRRLALCFSADPTYPGEKPLDTLAPLCEPELPGRLMGRWQAAWRRFEMLVCANALMPARRARLRVRLFFGVSFKGRVYSPRIRLYNHLFVVGEYMRRTFVEKGLLAADSPALHSVGMPKTDALVDGSLDRRALLTAYGLNPEVPTILYAPTWRKESSLNVEGEAILDALEPMGLNVLVKLHDHHRNPDTNRRDWGAWLEARETARLRLVRDADIVPSLHAADILVSDASSAANEFTLLDRPILFMDVPQLLRVYGATADLDTWGRKIGHVVKGAGNLRRAVERALAEPGAQSEVRRAAAADLFYNPGRATQAAVKTLYRILEMDVPGAG